jgi:hypothetical protein
MQRIAREQARKYAFDWEDEPLLRVECGESFEIETYDASTGYFRSARGQGYSVAPARVRQEPAAGQSDRRSRLAQGGGARRHAGHHYRRYPG